MLGLILFFNLLFISLPLLAQKNNFSFRLERTKNHFIQGLSESLEWYDIPVAGAFLTRRLFIPEDDDRLSISALPFESNLQLKVGKNGRISVGSMDKNTLPYAIIISRTVFNLGNDIFTEEGSSSESYKHTVLFGKALIYTFKLTEFIKNFTYKERPDKSDSRSFFSGHSSTTFTAASFLYRELDDFFDEWSATSDNDFLRTSFKTASFSILYGWAGYVAYSRMLDNKHYVIDVLIGAATGTIIANLIYTGYFSNEEKKYDFGLSIQNQTPSLYFVYSF
jgi:membrane-associated phospholipid phosphatase